MNDTQDLPAVVNLDREMSVQEISAQSLKIHHVLEAVMQEDIHYGQIPGTPKKTLYQAGAEKICMTFRLAPRYEVDDLSEPHNNFYRYRARCSVITISEGRFVGSAMGEASTLEEKYQWEKAVNQKHWDSMDPTRRRIHFKKDGTEVLQVQRNCADLANTVLKIACKRAFVSAVKGTTAASDLLDVDLDEEAVAELKNQEDKPVAKPKQKSRPVAKLPFGRSKGKSIDDQSVPVEDLEWMLKYISENVGSDKRKNYERQDREMMSALSQEIQCRGSYKESIPDNTWIDLCKLWMDRHEAEYAETCMHLGLEDAIQLQGEKRSIFQQYINNLLKK